MNKIDNSVKITGIIVLAVIVVVLLVVGSISSFANRETVRVDGIATIDVMPDIVSIQFAVETTGKTSKEAKDKNSEIANDVVDALMDWGFDREIIETINFNIYEEFYWSNDKRESIGFKATHDIRVKFEAEAQPELGPIVDAGVDSGALLRYVSFELSTELESQYKAQALELAGRDARTKADAMVRGVGGKIGKIISVSESSFGYKPWLAYDSRNLEAGTVDMDSVEAISIQIGEREIQGRVSAVYEIR